MPSKKPSGTNPPPERPAFFIDRSLGREPLATRLQTLGLSVKLHDDYFRRDEPDQSWLMAVAARDWVVLTKDDRLRYRPLEKASLFESGARVFILTAGNLGREDIARAFETAVPRMLRLLETTPAPFIATVTQKGVVTLLTTKR